MGKKKFYDSIVWRIVLIFLLLILLPLGIHSFLVWDRDYRQRLHTAFSELEILGRANEEIFSGWFHQGTQLLEAMALLSEGARQLEGANFFTLDRNFETIDSTQGEVDFPKDILQRAFSQGQLAFLHPNLLTGKTEIVVVKAIDGTLWGFTVDADQWLKKHGIYLQFIDKSKVIDERMVIFTHGQVLHWEEEYSLSEILAFKNKDFALRLSIPDTLFDIQVELPAEKIASYKKMNVINHLITLYSLVVLLGALVAWYLIAKLSRPLQHLYAVMDRVGMGDLDQRYHKSPFGFEINTLGERFNEMLSSLFAHMEMAKQERSAREKLSRELEIGREVQDRLLPKEFPQFPGLAIGTGFIPAKEVGGDFYDLYARDENTLFLTIADASDKGVSACFHSLIVRSMLRSHAVAEKGLHAIASDVNDLFCLDTKDSGEFVTTWMALYHAKNHLLTYTSMGHPPALLCHEDGIIEELKTDGLALGAMKGPKIEVRSKTVLSNDLLVLYSDGVIEAQNERGELFGKSRLLEFVRNHHTAGPQKLVDLLIDEIEEFSSNVPQHDDLTVLCIQFTTA